MQPAVQERIQAILARDTKGLSPDEFIEAMGVAAGAFIDMNWKHDEREAAIARLLEAVRSVI